MHCIFDLPELWEWNAFFGGCLLHNDAGMDPALPPEVFEL